MTEHGSNFSISLCFSKFGLANYAATDHYVVVNFLVPKQGLNVTLFDLCFFFFFSLFFLFVGNLRHTYISYNYKDGDP